MVGAEGGDKKGESYLISREILVQVFSIQDANKCHHVAHDSNSDPIFPDANSIVAFRATHLSHMTNGLDRLGGLDVQDGGINALKKGRIGYPFEITLEARCKLDLQLVRPKISKISEFGTRGVLSPSSIARERAISSTISSRIRRIELSRSERASIRAALTTSFNLSSLSITTGINLNSDNTQF